MSNNRKSIAAIASKNRTHNCGLLTPLNFGINNRILIRGAGNTKQVSLNSLQEFTPNSMHLNFTVCYLHYLRMEDRREARIQAQNLADEEDIAAQGRIQVEVNEDPGYLAGLDPFGEEHQAIMAELHLRLEEEWRQEQTRLLYRRIRKIRRLRKQARRLGVNCIEPDPDESLVTNPESLASDRRSPYFVPLPERLYPMSAAEHWARFRGDWGGE